MTDKFPKEYIISAQLLQDIVTVLGEQPARITRNILNAIEYVVNEQNESFDKKQVTKKDTSSE